MTLALYARRKAWPLQGVEVRLRHSQIHAADCCPVHRTLTSEIDIVSRLV